jgi:RNA polymerase sigma factor (TIGR02999 family)
MPGPQKARADAGDRVRAQESACDDIFSLVYEELRRLASFVRKNEAHATINSTALVHEAWLKLKESPAFAATSLAHFRAVAIRAMRQVLVDEARRRNAGKRGGGGVVFLEADASTKDPRSTLTWDEEVLALHDALEELAAMNPRQSEIVESRYFGGLTVAEVAETLGMSESAVERDWRVARAWLASRIRPG